MPLSPAAANIANMSAMDLYRAVHSSKGFGAPETHGIGGVIIKVCKGVGDALADKKVSALRGAIWKIASKGLVLPGEITLYTSEAKTFVNVAFQRDLGGTQTATIGL